MPLTSLSQAQRFGASLPEALSAELTHLHNDPQATMHLGVAHATWQCLDLLSNGAPGIHFYTMNRSTATRAIYSAIRIHGLAPSAK
jgi:methylenetetrahydrofolate reductase (NADPH)